MRLDKDSIPATKTSVKLGQYSGPRFVTTHSLKYNDANAYGILQKVNKDFIRDIKSNHFECGDRRPQSAAALNYHYQSNTKQSYDYKGEASRIAAKLDESQKDDLRRNHFEIGGNTANVSETTVSKQFRPLSATQRKESRPEINRSQLNELRRSHWSTTPSSLLLEKDRKRPGSAKQFVTTHMQAFQWIQPRPAH